MTMATVPLGVLIGAAIGMLTTGAVYAAEKDEVGEYLMGIVFSCIFYVLFCCGLEALIKAGWA